jgi:magnesium chelatase subunit H
VLEEYRAAPRESTAVEEVIQQKIAVLHLDTELVRQHDEPFDAFVSRVYVYLRTLEQRLIVDRLHILGEVQSPDQLRTLLTERLKVAHETMPSLAELVLDTVQTRQAAKNDHQHTTGKTSTRADDGPIRNGQHHPANGRLPAEDTHLHTYQEVLKAVRMGNADALRVRDALDAACITFVQHAVLDQEPVEQAWKQAITEYCRSGSFSPPASSFTHQVSPDRMLVLQSLTDYARKMLAALQQNTQEIEFLLKGLRGEYIPAVHGGDLLRDGLSVLPTGRNIHSLDPFRIPSDAAFARGTRIAESLIQAHQAAHNNAYPETIAQVLWGIDTIKTKGEAIGTILSLIGAKRIKDGLGKIERYELLPLDEVGHPRIDVLITASGVFRDTFAGTMDMLDRLIREAAAADEPEEQNFIRKHVQELVRQGISFEDATARMFTQAAGTYGTEVEGLVEGGTWEQREELEDMFVKRNMYAYGGTKGGTAHAEVLQSLLGTVQHVAQEIDSVEYGLTDIPYYYSYSGALRAAAERRSGQQVDLSYIESFTAETKVQELDQALRVEYRTKLLNPAWYESMLRHGYNGAVEITNRFTYMLGWSATTGAVDNWVYDESAATFILDDAMRQRLEAANPEGLRNAVSRLLEASDRDLWQTNEETLERLRALHADLEDRLEGVI